MKFRAPLPALACLCLIVPPLAAQQEQERRLPALSANLDSLLNFAELWAWSADSMEMHYTAKADDPKQQKKPPQFEWMSADKSRARFSRHMFSNVETKLTMFAGSINVQEAVLEFVNGKAAKSTISFYNRGDNGDIEVAEFDRIFKAIGQNLGQVLKVAPKRQLMSTNAALPVSGWMWNSPAATALLEYNEYNVPGKALKPEFLRLKLAAPGQADFTMGRMVTGVQSMELVKRVTKKPDGDVYITGVPMVDQGQKGYCVAASCQRLFEYMRIPCDQHEMAQLVSVDAESGANVFGMQKSLAKIDGRFKVTFKPLINPEQYYSGSTGKRRVSDKQFTSIVKEYVNKGVPLLWALELGRVEEDPPLPGSGQTRGGHMRMIIGYNEAKRQILFTDSWGAGHELKRMPLLGAYDVTIGLYSMAPRGL
ncbi:MAG: C39 family peptidase [Verrucomicrobiaceae bacterium]|nr:C39 family peptidase [Verrucomicrobiaceae bacterium]